MIEEIEIGENANASDRVDCAECQLWVGPPGLVRQPRGSIDMSAAENKALFLRHAPGKLRGHSCHWGAHRLPGNDGAADSEREDGRRDVAAEEMGPGMFG